MRLATDLEQHLSPATLAADPAPARHILSELSGKLLMHLAAEDNVLYPKLLKSTDANARALAQRFVTEMHPITDAFKQYAGRRGNAKTIQGDPDRTKEITNVLGERIRREHAELYRLADTMTH
ncbi:MAG TPA: hemerythrin domain-containing protein [Steroidobacteraceae bacterium]|nr:hemerythrin domain-containing protein [Steroidobacteraceae bacterium]